MKCESCGAEINTQHRICTFCGSVASPAIMNDKSNLVIDSEGQAEAGKFKSEHTYKLKQDDGFSKQNIPVSIEYENNLDKAIKLEESQIMDFAYQRKTQKQNTSVNQSKQNDVEQSQLNVQGQKNNSAHRNYNTQQQINKGSTYHQQMMGQTPKGELLTRSEFFKIRQVKKCREFIFASIIILYFYIIITLFKCILGLSQIYLFDVAILLACTLGLQFKQRRACAVLLIIYQVLVSLVIGIITGEVVGIFTIFAGVFSVIGTFKFEEMWLAYQKTGILPYEERY